MLLPEYVQFATGTILASATYNLEGDSILSVFAYDEIADTHAQLTQKNWPTVSAFINSYPQQEQQELHKRADLMFGPVLSYFEKRFIGNDAIMALEMSRFSLARFANPTFFSVHRALFPTDFVSVAGRKLKMAMPYLANEDFDKLQHEAVVYASAAPTFAPTHVIGSKTEQWKAMSKDLLAWWKLHECRLPTWAQFARRVFVIQPSSASVERVFSILNNIYTKDRYSSLNDVIELSCMYIYNSRDV